MKRWPALASFVLFIALCASAAYWAMQWFQPPSRPVAAPPPAAPQSVNVDAAAGLFGGRSSVAVASNYELRGVVVSGDEGESIAILATEGKPAQAVRVNAELAPGVKVQEVRRGYVVLSENGVAKRVELPQEIKPQAGADPAGRPPVPGRSAPAQASSSAEARRSALFNQPPPAQAAPPSTPAASQGDSGAEAEGGSGTAGSGGVGTMPAPASGSAGAPAAPSQPTPARSPAQSSGGAAAAVQAPPAPPARQNMPAAGQPPSPAPR